FVVVPMLRFSETNVGAGRLFPDIGSVTARPIRENSILRRRYTDRSAAHSLQPTHAIHLHRSPGIPARVTLHLFRHPAPGPSSRIFAHPDLGRAPGAPLPCPPENQAGITRLNDRLGHTWERTLTGGDTPPILIGDIPLTAYAPARHPAMRIAKQIAYRSL